MGDRAAGSQKAIRNYFPAPAKRSSQIKGLRHEIYFAQVGYQKIILI